MKLAWSVGRTLLAWGVTAYVIATWVPWYRYNVDRGSGTPQDFLVYLHAARDLSAGVSPYAPREALPFTYPPFAAVLFLPWTVLDDVTAYRVWTVVNVVLAAVLLVRLLGRGPVSLMILMVATAPISRSLYLGQINLVLAALVLVDQVWTPQWLRRWTGVLTGVAAAIKVTPAFFAVTFLVRRRWADLLRTVAAGAGITLVLFALYPALSTDFWFAKLLDPTRVGALDYPDNQSLTGLASRWLGDTSAGRRAGLLLAVGVVALCVVAIRRQLGTEHERLAALTAAGLASCLISPVSWSHHFVWLIPLVALLHGAGWRLLAWLVTLALVREPLEWAERFTTLHPLVVQVGASAYAAMALIGLVWLAAVRLPERSP